MFTRNYGLLEFLRSKSDAPVILTPPPHRRPPAQPLDLAREKKGNRSIKPARVIESNRQLMEGACGVIVAEDGRRGKGAGRGGAERRRIFLEFCARVDAAPLARCEEVTLRPHVPHPLLPGDQCAEHGPQEYRPAAGKGHTEESGAYRIHM